MNHQCYNVIGVMSGTSLDAIDIILVQLVKNESWDFHILNTKSIEYSAHWKERLLNGIELPTNDLENLNKDYTKFLGSIIRGFIEEYNIDNLLAVCSHGHTISHRPDLGYTLQIGNLPEIAQMIGVRTICDFRVQDVNLGGQGAPLVPVGDELLFSQYDSCLNLGGFANISFNKDGQRIAFDISPVNVVLNHFAKLLNCEYDDKGFFAKAGNVKSKILNQLNELSYYNLQAPKSLGVEWVNTYVWEIMSSIVDPRDALATFTEHIAIQIARVLKQKSKVLVTGGGAYNDFLINRIIFHSKAELIIPDYRTIEFKEALIFALLGVLRLRNENNIMYSVTGASKDHCSGEIYLP